MSDAPTDTKDKPAKPKGKGGGMVKSLLTVVAIIVGAAAGGFGGVVGAAKLGLVGGGGGHAAPAPAPHGPVEYVEIDNAFTSNLVDTGRYLQLRISVSTTGGADVVAAIQQHKPALISMVLAVLGELAEADVADRPAKDKLRRKLKAAINDVLRSKGVTGDVEDVFFTSLVVQ